MLLYLSPLGDKCAPRGLWIYSSSLPRKDYKWGTRGNLWNTLVKGEKNTSVFRLMLVSHLPQAGSKKAATQTHSILIITYLQSEGKGQ
jgi:hypothetical protein